jgi:hypothetical protein
MCNPALHVAKYFIPGRWSRKRAIIAWSIPSGTIQQQQPI